MSTVAEIRSKGVPRRVPLHQLRLDAHNPRLPPELQGAEQEELAINLELGFDALTVAESISSHGYFGSEPLIVVSGEEPETWTVVEGNRRLTALLGLADEGLRASFAGRSQWEALATHASVGLGDLIPVVELGSRSEATPIIGFRHISGILKWEPYAQARYVARLVDEERMSFAEVAEMIGIDRTRVANLYRDQAIANQAADLGIDTGQIERAFTLMTVAMSTPKLRAHIGADLGTKTTPGEPPIREEKHEELRELIIWLYGDGEVEPVIGESRDISKLGNVVAVPVGLVELRAGKTLEHAVQRVKDASENPRQRLVSRLRTGRNALAAALEDLPEFLDDGEVAALVEEVEAAADDLKAALDQ